MLRASFNRSIDLRSAWSVLRSALIRQQLLGAMFSLLCRDLVFTELPSIAGGGLPSPVHRIPVA